MTQNISSSAINTERPILLGSLQTDKIGIFKQDQLIAYPHYWQEPAATERAAYEAMASSDVLLDFVYFGFPWAALIDGLRADSASAFKILTALEHSESLLPAKQRVITVAQHIHADQYASIFRACGVTDVFWSHCRKNQENLHGVRFHPFSLFPAQTANEPIQADPHRPRKWLATFIGAHNPKVYLTDVRAIIFEDAGRYDDVLIVKRDSWHFQRAVYEQQVASKKPEDAQLAAEEKMREEYLESLRDSTFTLCPSGSGPNSIRIFESLSVASIPIILTRELALPGDQRLWEAACIVEDDSADGYRRAINRARSMSESEIRARQTATQLLFSAVGPKGYAELMLRELSADMQTIR